MLLATVLVLAHSFTSATADPVTAAPLAKRTPSSHHNALARKRQAAAGGALPLTQYNYPYDALPYQVNPYPPAAGTQGRGPQTGYNRCNSTTEGPNSLCQTLIVNSLADFCLWGSPTNNGSIGDIEAETVAFCTLKGHGTRIMPFGTITGAQFIRTSAYIQVTGTFDQRGIGLNPDDGGGELDPHGADLLGNPLGGLVYSKNLPVGSDGKTYKQSQSWNNFVGSNQFCIKVCDPTVTSPDYCENRYDLLGCYYNMPAAYTQGEFTSCDGELQDVVGTYTSDGKTLTWKQPESLSPTTTLPWQPRIPASSNCKTYSSAALYGSGVNTLSPIPSSTSVVSSSVATSISGGAANGAASSSRVTGSSSAPAATSSGTSGASTIIANTGLFAILGAIVMAM